jgi:hypothetical protein
MVSDVTDSLFEPNLYLSDPLSYPVNSSNPLIAPPSISPVDRCYPADRSRHYMLDLLDMHRGVERVVEREVSLFKIQSNIDLKELEKLEMEKQIVFRKYAKEAAASNNWSMFSNIAQYLTSGASIVLGASVFIAKPRAGGLLIASGIAGLTNRLMHETGGWNAIASWCTKSIEYQKKIAHVCEMTFLGFEFGVGLAGGSMAYKAGAFSIAGANRTALANTAANSIKIAGQSIQAVSQLGKSFSDYRVGDLQGKIQMFDALAEERRIAMNQQVTSARNFIETAQDISQEMHKAIAATEVQA